MEPRVKYEKGSQGACELHDRTEAPACAEDYDPVIEHFKTGVDRTQLRQNLKLSPDERLQKFIRFAKLADKLREAGRQARKDNPVWGLE